MEFEQYMRQFLVKVLDAKGGLLGTGFWVLPEGYCLTCFHVIANRGKLLQSPRLEYNNTIIQSTYESEISNPSKDIAVLRVTEKDFQPVPTVHLGPARMDTTVRLYGYREGFAEGYSITGSLHPGQTLQNVGKVYNFQTTFPDQSTIGGMSGAPVFDPKRNMVVGILYGEEKQGPSVSYVHPLEKVYEYWPALVNRIRRFAPSRAEQCPEKDLAILDRRMATEIITIFNQPDSSMALEPRVLQLLKAGIGLFDQLVIENIYGSALAPIIYREDILKAVTFIGKVGEQEEEEFLEVVEEDEETRTKDSQFQVIISQYERSKGIASANVSENMAYLRHTLLLARQLNAVIIPHPERWPLYHWLFEHCIFSDRDKTNDSTMMLLPMDIANSVRKIPETRAKRVAALSSRYPQKREIPIALYRYGPMTYPFSKARLRSYDQADLASFESFLYEFCAPTPASSDQERI